MYPYNGKMYQFNVEVSISEIQEIVNTLRGPRLKNFVKDKLNTWLEMLLDAPRASFNHEDFQGGLLLHTCYVMRYTLDVYKRMEFPSVVDYDCMILGALLHDIGKVIDPNNMKQHPRVGAEYVYEVFKDFGKVRERLVLIVGNHMLDREKNISKKSIPETVIVNTADAFAAVAGLRYVNDKNEVFWYHVAYPEDAEKCLQTLYVGTDQSIRPEMVERLSGVVVGPSGLSTSHFT